MLVAVPRDHRPGPEEVAAGPSQQTRFPDFWDSAARHGLGAGGLLQGIDCGGAATICWNGNRIYRLPREGVPLPAAGPSPVPGPLLARLVAQLVR